jgi:hypothetical protein
MFFKKLSKVIVIVFFSYSFVAFGGGSSDVGNGSKSDKPASEGGKKVEKNQEMEVTIKIKQRL